VILRSGEFDYIRNLVRQRSALVLEPGKEYFVESRLDPLAVQEGCSSLHHLIGRLQTLPFGPLHRKVVEAMTVNETTFFRDARVFEVLRTIILPEILKNRIKSRTLNVWFAACSTGQEPYSFAMLLREHFGFALGWNLQLIASDLSSEALGRARQGRYSQLEVNRGLPAPLLLKYFQKQEESWQLNAEVCRMVEFRKPCRFVADVTSAGHHFHAECSDLF
jgi:chemotaxis protein methyltransferase CheR